MEITAESFQNGMAIPAKHTCQGENISPALKFHNVPKETVSLVLIMDDPDAPGGTFDHWLIWNIAPDIVGLQEGQKGLEMGLNSFVVNRYRGPCPPPGASHRYFFKLYALSKKLNLPSKTKKKQLEAAMQGHILSQANLIGTFRI